MSQVYVDFDDILFAMSQDYVNFNDILQWGDRNPGVVFPYLFFSIELKMQ